MKTLHVHNLETKVGDLGITLQAGRQWMMNAGEIVNLCNSRHDKKGKCKIEFTKLYPFEDIPIKFLSSFKVSDTYAGLLYIMKQIYGNKFRYDAEVTIVGYRRLK